MHTDTYVGRDIQIFQSKIVNIFLFIKCTCVFGAQKNRLIETFLLSTQNKYFALEKEK